jgi:hypothetical protein
VQSNFAWGRDKTQVATANFPAITLSTIVLSGRSQRVNRGIKQSVNPFSESIRLKMV